MASLSSSATPQEGQRRIVANKPVDVALNEIVTRARVFTDAGGAAIALRDGDEIVTRASSGTIAPDVGTRMSVDGSLTGQALVKGMPIHVENSDTDPRVDAETCRALNTRSFIITPIAGSTTMLGVLAVFAPTPNAFTRTDLAVLRTMSDQISAALGGGAFIQQGWSTSRVESGTEAATFEEPQPEVAPPAPAPARAEKPKPPVIADVEFESLRPVKAAAAPKVEAPKAEPPRVEVRVEVPKVEAARKIEATAVEAPKAQPIPEPVKSEAVRPAVAGEKAAVPKEVAAPVVEANIAVEEVTSIAEEVEKPKQAAKVPPRTTSAVSAPERPVSKGRMRAPTKAEPQKARSGGVSLDSIIAARAKEVDPITGRDDAAREQQRTRKEEKADVVEWKGLSSAEPEPRNMGRLVIGGVAVLVVVGAIAAAVIHKSPSTATAVPAATAAVSAASAPADPQTAASTTSGVKPGTTAVAPPSKKDVAQAPATAATQTQAQSAPSIVLAPSAGSAKPAVEDAAPPQLAFAGEKPKLMETGAAVPVAATPKRVTSDPVQAQLVRRVAPAYPEMARRLRQKGTVELQAQVLKDGSIGKIDVLSGAALLRPAAVDAVKQWRYRPAQISGAPVESQVRIVISFDERQ